MKNLQIHFQMDMQQPNEDNMELHMAERECYLDAEKGCKFYVKNLRIGSKFLLLWWKKTTPSRMTIS
jgi:hypothetical protein